MSESRRKDDWRWIAILLGRIVGYSFVGLAIFTYACGLALLNIDIGNTPLNPALLAGIVSGISFGYAATRSKPRQSADPDSQLLFNLVFWSVLVTAFGAILLAVTLNFVNEFLKLPDISPSWSNYFVLIRPTLILLCWLGFQVFGVHLALVRVENKRNEAREGRSEIAN